MAQNKTPNQNGELFQPTEEVVANANIKEYDSLYKRSIEDREGFWAGQAENLDWYRKWDKVLDQSKAPFYKWFTGGKINIIHSEIINKRPVVKR